MHGKGKLVLKDGSSMESETFQWDYPNGEVIFTKADGITKDVRKYDNGELVIRNGIAEDSYVGTDHEGGASEAESVVTGGEDRHLRGDASDAAGAGGRGDLREGLFDGQDDEDRDLTGEGGAKRARID